MLRSVGLMTSPPIRPVLLIHTGAGRKESENMLIRDGFVTFCDQAFAGMCRQVGAVLNQSPQLSPLHPMCTTLRTIADFFSVFASP